MRPHLPLALLALALSLLVAAEPADPPRGVSREGARVPLVRWDVPEGGAGRLRRRGQVGIQIGQQRGGAYSIPVRLGPSTLYLSPDTGSSDTWAILPSCTSHECADVPAYDLPSSSTFRPVNANQSAFALRYADSTAASGLVGREDVGIGNLTVEGLLVGMVNQTNVTLQEQGISGVLGLGFERLSLLTSLLFTVPLSSGGLLVPSTTLSSLSPISSSPPSPSSPPPFSPFLQTLSSTGALSYPLFGLHLPKSNSTNATLSLGGLDGDVVRDESMQRMIEWHDLVPFAQVQGEIGEWWREWVVRVQGVQVNGTNVTITPSYEETRGSLALLDSATSGISGPPGDVFNIFNEIQLSRHVGNGQYAVPCDIDVPISFSFGGQQFLLYPEDYIYARVSGSKLMCLAWPVAAQAGPDGVDWVLGTPFLHTVYSVYSFGIASFEPPKIGLLPLSSLASAFSTSISSLPTSSSTKPPTAALPTLTELSTTLTEGIAPQPTYPSPQPYLFASPTRPLRSSSLDGYAPSTVPARLSAAEGVTGLPMREWDEELESRMVMKASMTGAGEPWGPEATTPTVVGAGPNGAGRTIPAEVGLAVGLGLAVAVGLV